MPHCAPSDEACASGDQVSAPAGTPATERSKRTRSSAARPSAARQPALASESIAGDRFELARTKEGLDQYMSLVAETTPAVRCAAFRSHPRPPPCGPATAPCRSRRASAGSPPSLLASPASARAVPRGAAAARPERGLWPAVATCRQVARRAAGGRSAERSRVGISGGGWMWCDGKAAARPLEARERSTGCPRARVLFVVVSHPKSHVRGGVRGT